MAKSGTTGPRVLPRAGPRVMAPQPAPPPTIVQAGGDRMLAGAREIDFEQLTPDLDQPRRHMHPERLAELADSIARHGVLEPLIVRQDGLGRDGNMRYIVVAGGRRYAAIKLLLERDGDEGTRRRVARVPVVINDSAAAERRVLQLIENLQREDLNPVDEARALKEILRIERLTTAGLAARVHRSQGYVDERLRLLRHEDVEEAVETGLVPKSAGAAIASLPSADERRAWIERARAGETIRAREVYAAKPQRHRRAAGIGGATGGALDSGAPAIAPVRRLAQQDGPSSALPNFGNPQPGEIQDRINELRAETPDLTGPEAHHLATLEARDRAGSAVAARPPAQGPTPEEGTPTGIATGASGARAAGEPDAEAAIVWLRTVRHRLRASVPPAGHEQRAQLQGELRALREAVDALLVDFDRD